MQFAAVPALTIGQAIAGFLAAQNDLSFVQVGGFDGINFDPLRIHIECGRLSGLIIEPMPEPFAKLQALYAHSDRIRVCNCAIDVQEGERTMWRFKPSAIESGLLSPQFAGINSLMMHDLLRDDGSVGRMFDENQRALLRRLVEPRTVHCRTLESVLTEYDISRIDLLQIDTEGFDLNILGLFNFHRFRPAIIHYETMHLNGDERHRAEDMLAEHGYRTCRHEHDTLGIRGVFLAPVSFDPAPILALAASLCNDGRMQDALTLYEHTLSIEPQNHQALAGAMTSLTACGRVKEALQHLITLKRVTIDADKLKQDIHYHVCGAIEIYNCHLRAGEFTEAADYIASIVLLVPNNKALLEQAFILNQRLGRREPSAEYAAALLKLEPSHYAARIEMASFCQARGDTQAETEHLVHIARHQPDELHSAVRLHNIYMALCSLMVNDLDDTTVGLVKQFIDLARSIPPSHSASAGEHFARADTHYRLAIDAIDLSAIIGPTPDPYSYPRIAFATSSGQAMVVSDLVTAAARQRADVLFFVAADAAYVELYARLYVSSVLRCCDVGCLVIVHVIGGINRLNEVSKSVGISDRRLIFSGDDFNSGDVECRCFSEPPGRWGDLAAHYQSARFLWLGYFLQELRLPVIVSDIDLLMQSGVDDLLSRCSGSDVTFNENLLCKLYGGRITANLLLVNPTDSSALFARFVRSYLDKALQQTQVTRWIDQCALMTARHHLMRNSTPRFEYFDTQRDINNIIYSEFRENPFRFLSLYHGFDMSSLRNESFEVAHGCSTLSHAE